MFFILARTAKHDNNLILQGENIPFPGQRFRIGISSFHLKTGELNEIKKPRGDEGLPLFDAEAHFMAPLKTVLLSAALLNAEPTND